MKFPDWNQAAFGLGLFGLVVVGVAVSEATQIYLLAAAAVLSAIFMFLGLLGGLGGIGVYQRAAERVAHWRRVRRLNFVAVRPIAGFDDRALRSQYCADGHRWWKRPAAEQHYVLGNAAFVYAKDRRAFARRVRTDEGFRRWVSRELGLSATASRKEMDKALRGRQRAARRPPLKLSRDETYSA